MDASNALAAFVVSYNDGNHDAAPPDEFSVIDSIALHRWLPALPVLVSQQLDRTRHHLLPKTNKMNAINSLNDNGPYVDPINKRGTLNCTPSRSHSKPGLMS